MPLIKLLRKGTIDSHEKVLTSPYFEKLVCSGKHYDMGLQQGKRFKRKISRNEKILAETELFRKFVPSFIPLPFLLHAAKKILPVFIPSVLSGEKDIFSRLNGIADGAGVDRELIFLTQALEIILDHIPYHAGCTTVAITPGRFIDKEPVIIRNFDFLDNFRVFNIIRRSNPLGGIPSLELSFTSIAGSHTGINREGLALSYNYGYSKEPQQARVPLTCHVQSALEKFRTTQQAVNFFLNKPFSAGAILTICDAEGNLVTLEGSPTKKALRYPDNNGLIINTNRFMTDEMQSVNIPDEALFDKNMPYGLDKVRIHESNEQRAKTINREFNKTKNISVDTIFKVLSHHGDDNNAFDNCACRHLPIFQTIASAVMFPKRRTAYFLVGSPCRKKYHKYNFR